MTEDNPADPTEPPGAHPDPQPPGAASYPPAYPPAGQPGWGQPGWGPHPGVPAYPTYVLPDHPRATAALVVGLVSVAGAFICLVPILASPVAWVIGAQARREIRNAPQQWGGDGRATAGMVLGIIGTVLLVLGLILLALLIVAIVATDGGADFETETGV
ncbi:MAG TPA: DUF4190 domain-containing protein [Marmoricola sp.]